MVTRSENQVPAGSERLWRSRIETVVGSDEIKALGRQSVPDTLGVLGLLWAEVITLLVIANLVPRWSLTWAVLAAIVVVVLMGTRMNAFGVVLHEGSHGLLARSRKLNDRLCNWGAAFWSINSVEEYRPTHRLHHRYLGSDRDPDRDFYLVPARRGALTWLVFQDLVGVTAFRRATTRIAGTSQESGAPASLLAKPQLLLGKVVTQAVLVGQFIVFQGLVRGIVFYATFWLVPIVCLYPMILRLKTITEHFDPGLRDPANVRWTARSSAAGWCQNHVIGARMEYHFEHHVLPTIPFRGLRELHRRLDRSGLFESNRELLSEGYVLFLARAVTGKVNKINQTNRTNRAEKATAHGVNKVSKVS